MKKVFIIMLFLNILMTACKKERNFEVFGNQIYNKIDDVSWFLGNWKNETNEMDFREIWVKENDSMYNGTSYITVKNDTVFSETVDLVERNDSLFYIVSAKNQNNEQPVSFYMTHLSKNEITFENPKHDFPTKISYKKIKSDSIVATIEGIQKGKSVTQDFPMKRY